MGESARGLQTNLCSLLALMLTATTTPPTTFQAIRKELGAARRPAHYLAIPPSNCLGWSWNNSQNRVVIRGRASSLKSPSGMIWHRRRNSANFAHPCLMRKAIFRIDHYLGKRPVHNMQFSSALRIIDGIVSGIANTWRAFKSRWQEDFGVQGRGAFYDQTGAIHPTLSRNHLFSGPGESGDGASRANGQRIHARRKGQGLKSHAAAGSEKRDPSTVSGCYLVQKRGLRPNSQVETFAALRLDVNSWRHGKACPSTFRAEKKSLPVTCPGSRSSVAFASQGFSHGRSLGLNYFRFRISPDVTTAFGVTVMDEEEKSIGEPAELLASHHPSAWAKWMPTSGYWETPWQETRRCFARFRIMWKRPGASWILCSKAGTPGLWEYEAEYVGTK